MSNMPSPIDWEDMPPPPELDFSMPDDPFPDDLFSSLPPADDYLPDDDPYAPYPTVVDAHRRRTPYLE
jgi:hypothetical protein